MSVDLPAVRELLMIARRRPQSFDTCKAEMKLVPHAERMADEIEAYRDLLDRVEIEMQDRNYHNEDCGCRWCKLYHEVCRVNKETPDAP